MKDLQIIENNDNESDNGINNNCRRNDYNVSSEDDVPKEYNKKKKKKKLDVKMEIQILILQILVY